MHDLSVQVFHESLSSEISNAEEANANSSPSKLHQSTEILREPSAHVSGADSESRKHFNSTIAAEISLCVCVECNTSI